MTVDMSSFRAARSAPISGAQLARRGIPRWCAERRPRKQFPDSPALSFRTAWNADPESRNDTASSLPCRAKQCRDSGSAARAASSDAQLRIGEWPWSQTAPEISTLMWKSPIRQCFQSP